MREAAAFSFFLCDKVSRTGPNQINICKVVNRNGSIFVLMVNINLYNFLQNSRIVKSECRSQVTNLKHIYNARLVTKTTIEPF